MKEICFVLKLEDDIFKIKYSLFEKPIIVHEENEGTIALSVAPQMRPRTKHITIKYHHFWSFMSNRFVKIQHLDTREHITDIFTKPLDSDFFYVPAL